MFKRTKKALVFLSRGFTPAIWKGDDITPIYAPKWLALCTFRPVEACHRWSNRGGVQCPACACSDGESTIFSRVEVPSGVCWLVVQQLRIKTEGKCRKVHPPKQTWNLKMDPCKRRCLLETIISRFHVNFWGCIGKVLPSWKKIAYPIPAGTFGSMIWHRTSLLSWDMFPHSLEVIFFWSWSWFKVWKSAGFKWLKSWQSFFWFLVGDPYKPLLRVTTLIKIHIYLRRELKEIILLKWVLG